jgi:type VI secretion system secreted protein VgrG
MPELRTAQEADFVFEVNGFSGELRVLGFSGSEGISELFQFGLRLASDDAEIDIDSIVGQPAVLRILHDNGERKIHGIVSRFEQGSEGTDFTPYYAELVPEVWLTTQQFGCRIHQEMSVEDIISKELTDGGIAKDRFRFSLSGTHEQREYCVRYRESVWNFISRLLEDEGIFYFFEHTDDAAVLVMGDTDTVPTPIETPATIPFRDLSGTVSQEEAIFTYRYSQEIRPGKIRYRDFNFEKPTVSLEKDKTASRDDALEVYDYPGGYLEPDIGDTLAQRRLEAMQARRIIGLGESLVRRIIPGYKFTMDEHPRTDFNREYLLTWISHKGTQPHGGAAVEGRFEYTNEFRCIPSDVLYRPARRSPRPVVEGTQTAIVTGPSGEEIYPDKHGRVKVQFHWDREGHNDENSSCWIRVSQLWAGKNWGAMWIPRIGHEVIVDFLEGDPDKPIIIGRVYHGDNQPPYALPDNKTKSTIKSDSSKGGGGSNEIRFEDLKGSEEIYTHAQKDQNEVVVNNMSTSVGNDQSLTVGHDRTKTVKHDENTTIENNRTQTVNGTHTEWIKKDTMVTVAEGNYVHEVNTGTASSYVKADVTETYDASQNTTVKKDITITAATGKITITAKQDIKIGTKANAVLEAKSGRTVTVNSGNYSVKTEGGNIVLDASTSLQAKGGAKLELQVGGSQITLEPAKITLSSGSGMIILDPSGVTIQGALVKIN